MVSKMVCSLLSNFIGERVPLFAHWLFYSEMVIGLVLTLGALAHLSPVGLVPLLYAAFCFCGAQSYDKQRAEQRGEAWAPSLLAVAAAYYLQIGTGLLALLPFGFVARAESAAAAAVLVATGAVLLGQSAWALRTLLRGGWPGWP